MTASNCRRKRGARFGQIADPIQGESRIGETLAHEFGKPVIILDKEQAHGSAV